MGVIYIPIKVRNPLAKAKAIEVTAKVDSGATLLVLPGEVAKKLKLSFKRSLSIYRNLRSELPMAEVE